MTLTDGTDGEGTVTRTFTVTGISEYVTYSDSNYLLATLMQGYTGNNVWGEICVRYDFDENGEVEDTSLDYAFVSTGVSETVTNKDGNMIVSLPGRTLIEYDEDEKMYYLQFAASDGINYCMYVNLYSNTQYAYYVVHIVVRYHYFEVGDTAFCMGVTLFSDDPKYEVGYLYINSISEGDAEYWIPDYAFRLEIDGSIYYPVRTFDENDVETAVTYYYINVTLDDQATAPVYVMKSVTFTKEACNVYYSADGKSVFEISPTKGVLLATVDGFTDEYVNSSKYDEQTATYTVYVDAGIFTLKIVNGVAETEMIWDGKTITVDVSGITYFAEADAECYIYVWYKDGTNNGDFPGQKMTKGENGKYTYVANGKAIAGVKISRCSPTDGTVWNETGDITTFNDAHEIVVTEMHQPALS